MKKFSIISTLSLLALLAGCGCCNKRSCPPEACHEQACEERCDNQTDCCKEEVCEVAHVAPQQQRVSGSHSANVNWEKEDFA
ncbi:MAG: hypothetical protein AB7F19_06825 [Candidatus Babeliales bacterium]